jgi:hypothetical protein
MGKKAPVVTNLLVLQLGSAIGLRPRGIYQVGRSTRMTNLNIEDGREVWTLDSDVRHTRTACTRDPFLVFQNRVKTNLFMNAMQEDFDLIMSNRHSTSLL